jgi:glycosyltransferase involved in cell wall biosynthesis
VSVIIPARNAAGVLDQQLVALSQQSCDSRWEVIVVDDQSSDGTGDVVRDYQGALPSVRVIRTQRSLNAAHARNTGVEAASGRLLLFTDADDVVGEGWLSRMVEALDGEHIVAGRLDIQRLNAPWARESRPVHQQHGLQAWDVGGTAWLAHAGGPNLGVTRGLWEDIGPFDVGLDFVDDIDFCFRAQLAGYRLCFVFDAVVHYRLRASLRGICGQAYDWGRASVTLQQKFVPRGMPRPNPVREALGWLRVPLELALVRDRGGFARWLHTVGYRAGRGRGAAAVVRQRVGRLRTPRAD